MVTILVPLLSLTLLVPVILSVYILLNLRKRWSSLDGDTGTLLIAGAISGSGLSCLAYSMELLEPYPTIKLLLLFIRYIGNVVFILTTFYYCIWFTDLWTSLTDRVKWLICLPYLPAFVVIGTNSLHHLYYPEISTITISGYPQLVHSNGILYYPVQLYSLLLLVITAFLFIRWKISSPRAYGLAVLLVFCGFFTPLIGYLVYLSGYRPFGFLNLTSYFMFFTAVFFSVAVFQYKFFTLKPIAHQMVIESLPAGVVLLDNAMQVIEINPAAAGLLSLNEHASLGVHISVLLAGDDPVASFCLSGMATQTQVFREDRYLGLSLSRLQGYRNEQIGFLLLIMDITGEKMADQALRQANRQLSLLTSITRHDILNLITAALAYIDFAEDIPKNEKMSEYLDKIQFIVEKIQEQIEFTRVYENLGSLSPQWQQIGVLVMKSMIPPGISCEVECPETSIFADPLLPKVFDNLLDNSVRHGEHVTRIVITSEETPDGLIVAYGDNGIGICRKEKERIFDRGFGRNTGLGLFLAREILAMTGIAIRETGCEGKGARFELQVPGGRYRSGRSPEHRES